MKSNREKEYREKKSADLYVRFLSEFADENDRSCVLMIAAIADKMLEDILSKKLVKSSDKEDPLFKPHAPLNTFNDKINFAYRMGLISKKMHMVLHILRKIRNRFAHHIFDCNFNDGAVKDRLSELIESIDSFSIIKFLFPIIAERDKSLAAALKAKKEKADFLICTSALYSTLYLALQQIGQPIKPKEDESIFFNVRSALDRSLGA